jgi:hypothetical protein
MIVGRWIPAIVTACWLFLGGVQAAPPATSPAAGNTTPAASTTRPAPPAPAGRFIKLNTGILFIPDDLPHEQRQPDLLVHFHGDPPTVGHNVVASGINVPTLIINYPGLSAAYAKPVTVHGPAGSREGADRLLSVA